MFEPLPTPWEVAAWDKAAVEDLGVSHELLMENAARAAFAVLCDTYGDPAGARVILFAGPGNNGGDAVALARILADHGARALLLLAREKSAYRAPSAYFLDQAERLGPPMGLIADWDTASPPPPKRRPDIVVDGLFGSGFHGPLSPEHQRLISDINAMGEKAFVLSLDIPSGLDGMTGEPSPVAVKATATVTFEAAKIGLYAPGAAEYTGGLYVKKVGIPRQVLAAAPPRSWLMTPRLGAGWPGFDPGWHKGRAGHVLVVGGSPGLCGAPRLAGLGALRAGAGLVTLACPGGLEQAVRGDMAEPMTLPLGAGPDWSADQARELAAHLSRFDALAVGPGLGRTPGAAAFLAALVEILRRDRATPAVFDADALYHLAAMVREKGFTLPQGSVITPHPGEAARLLGLGQAGELPERTRAVAGLAALTPGAAVLKGAFSLVCSGEGEGQGVFVSPFAAPNLAVGGSGDVLAGIVASLLARGVAALPAARLAVYVHGLAGSLLARDFPSRGNLAGEIAAALPGAVARLVEKARDCRRAPAGAGPGTRFNDHPIAKTCQGGERCNEPRTS